MNRSTKNNKEHSYSCCLLIECQVGELLELTQA